MALYKNSFGNNVYFVSCGDLYLCGDIDNIIQKCWPHNHVLDYHIIDISDYEQNNFVICINRNVYPYLKNNLPFHISPYFTSDVAGEMQNPYEWLVHTNDQKEVMKQLRIIRNLNIIHSSIDVCEYKKYHSITFSREEYEGSIAIAKSIISHKTKIDIQWSNLDKFVKKKKKKKTNISNFYELLEQDVESS